MRRKKNPASWIALLAVVGTLCASACGPRAGGAVPVFGMPKADLSAADKDALHALAVKLLEGGDRSVTAGATPALTRPGASGVFLSHAVPKGRAWSSFGMGDSIAEATAQAASLLADKTRGAPWRRGVLKIDVVNGSSRPLDLSLDEKVGFDRTLTGVVCDLTPRAALLPEELTGWNIVSEKDLFQKNNLGHYLEFQKRGSLLADLVKDKRPVKYASFPTISFGAIEGARVDFYRGRRTIDRVDPDALLAAAKAGSEQLARFVGADGRFVYQYRAELDRDEKTYNDLHHCGAVFAMLDVYSTTKDPAVLAAARRAIDYAVGKLEGPPPRDAAADWLAIKSRGKGRNPVFEARLGGAGMCLLMLAEYQAATGDARYLDKARKVAKFIQSLQRPDGSFASKYYYDQTAEVFASPYYPGEAMLGLLSLYKLTHDGALLASVTKGLDYVVLVRDKDKTAATIRHDVWVMRTIGEAYPLAPKAPYLAHLKKLGEAIRASQVSGSAYPDLNGGFGKAGASKTAATRGEGLAAGIPVLASVKDPASGEWIETARRTAAFELRCQYADESAMYLRNPAKALGGFKKALEDYEMRVDITQHNVSSLLGLWRVLREKAGAPAPKEAP